MMKTALKSRAGMVITGVTLASGLTTIFLNAQIIRPSDAVREIVWCVALAGLLAIFIGSVAWLVLIATRGGKLLANDHWARLLCYATYSVMTLTSLALAAWVVVEVGLLPLLIVESAMLINVVAFALLRKEFRAAKAKKEEGTAAPGVRQG
jgi:hypothetical protein